MINDRIDLKKDPATPSDAFWYGVVGLLGDLQEQIITRFIKAPVWRSFNGKVRTPRMLSDEHLRNTIAMIERRRAEGEDLPPEYPALFAERLRRLDKKRQEPLYDKLRRYALDEARHRPRRETVYDLLRLEEQKQADVMIAALLPPGWQSTSTGKLFRHTETGAVVSRSKEGRWLWYRAHKHHIPCHEPKDTREEAIAAALED